MAFSGDEPSAPPLGSHFLPLFCSVPEMDWREIELVIFSVETSAAEGLLCLPEDGQLHALRLERKGEENDFVFTEDPLQRRVDWRLRTGPSES